MTILRRIRQTCPANAAAAAICLLLILMTFALEPLTIGMRFFWFFMRFEMCIRDRRHISALCAYRRIRRRGGCRYT